MTAEEALEMFVGGLVLDPTSQAPVVVLKDETGSICLPIWIGVAEATSIATAIKQVKMERPLTHDLMSELFVNLDVRVERVVITELKDSTYYAELILSRGDHAMIIDSRPSDAIALALRASAPIFVVQKVLDQAKITFEGQQLISEGPANEAEEGAEGDAPEQSESTVDQSVRSAKVTASDLSPIDKEQWEKILLELDPDDFKYKV